VVHADGHEPVTVASRFGTLTLPRQVCSHPQTQRHVIPGNAVLPPHNGIIITRGLQEWACLLPQELPFVSVARLLGWQTHDEDLLSDTTIRSLVRSHGQIIRQAEQAEVLALARRDDLASLELTLVPHEQPRRRAGWPAELNAAVDAALAREQVRPPEGVSWADWERVLAARQAEATRSVEEVRHLGPELDPEQVLLTVDEVLTRKPEAGHFLELRTARIMTKRGSRYLSGVGQAFLQRLHVAVLLCLGPLSSLLLIADGARWIRSFFTGTLAGLKDKTMLLDWHHLQQKCLELSSRICRSKAAKAHLLRRLYRRLWRGDVGGAIAVLEAERAVTKNETKLDELMTYLQARTAWIPNYRQRRIERQYIGSAHVEKANDLLVARRQKNRGMQWSEATSDALAALRTLMLNGGWDRYWQQREVLPLLAC
ncbi:MAG TPA: UPF0236 family protein, partial [Herpetosiphonaceae bacterium]|nr:UPF0236 family protein [Herpetosiphonaceae bacterium]